MGPGAGGRASRGPLGADSVGRALARRRGWGCGQEPSKRPPQAGAGALRGRYTAAMVPRTPGQHQMAPLPSGGWRRPWQIRPEGNTPCGGRLAAASGTGSAPALLPAGRALWRRPLVLLAGPGPRLVFGGNVSTRPMGQRGPGAPRQAGLRLSLWKYPLYDRPAADVAHLSSVIVTDLPQLIPRDARQRAAPGLNPMPPRRGPRDPVHPPSFSYKKRWPPPSDSCQVMVRTVGSGTRWSGIGTRLRRVRLLLLGLRLGCLKCELITAGPSSQGRGHALRGRRSAAAT